MRERSFLPGTVVAREGERCDGFYILRKGLAKEVVKSQHEEGEVTVALLRPGHGFGLLSVVDGMDNSSSLATIEACEFLVVGPEHIQRQLEEHPDTLRPALDHLCRLVREGHRWIASLL